MGVSHTLVRPLGFIFSALIVLHLGFWIYIVVDTFYPFRRCLYYWVYISLVVTLLLLILPSIFYLAAAIRYFRKLTTPPVNVVGLVKSKGVDKKIKNVLVIVFLSIIIILSILMFLHFLLVIVVHIVARPQQTGEIHVPLLTTQTKIIRDDEYVPHIFAYNAQDAAAAIGVAHATERLFQMDYNRRMANGTLAAAFGSRFVKIDKWFRALGFRKQAEREYSEMETSSDPNVIAAKSLIDAYTRGVNSVDRMKNLERWLIPGYMIEEWSPIDTLAVQKLFQWSLSHNYLNELLRYYLLVDRELPLERISKLMPLYSDSDTVTVTLSQLRELDPILNGQRKKFEQDNYLYEQQYLAQLQTKLVNEKKAKRSSRRSAAASDAETESPSTIFDLLKKWDPAFEEFGAGHQINTAFLVTGLLTSGGDPVLGADSNMRLQTPGQWMLLSISEGTKFSVIGASFVGIPGVLIGRTTRYAWGWSSSLADSQDIYIINGNDTSYNYQGSTLEYDVETIQVDARLGSSETITVRNTKYGVVLNDIIDVPGPRPLSLHWSALDTPVDTMFYGFWKMWHLDDYSRYSIDFADATLLITNPPLSILYTSGANNVSFEDLMTEYVHAGQVPVRRVGTFNHTGLFPVEGDGNRDWTGYLSTQIQQRFPQSSIDFLVASNNRAVESGYSVILSYDHGHKYRAHRIESALQKSYADGATINSDGVKKYMLDSLSLAFLERFKPALSLMDTTGLSEEANSAYQGLVNWNGEYALDSPEAMAFQNWLWELSKVFHNETGVDWYDIDALGAVFNSSGPDDQACITTGSTSCAEFAKQAFTKSIEVHGYGTSWAYRGVHEAYYSHILWDDWLSLDCACSRSATIAGGPDSVLYGGPAIPGSNNAYSARIGASYRQIVDFTGGISKLDDRSSFIVPVGNSGNLFFDSQYDQYMGRWGDGDMLAMNMRREGTGAFSSKEEQNLVLKK